jgi:hypothetical protein
MSNFYSNKAFKLGIFAGILIYVLIYGYNQPPERKSLCFDCYETSGFPFTSHESGTILHLDRTLWLGIIANILIAILFIFAAGLVSNFAWSKIFPRRANLK